MRLEICRIFAKPMGLSLDDIQRGRVFPFDYLQRTGSGARSLCCPSVSENFEWNGKQVSTLVKSGGFIYVLATRPLPGWLAVVRTYKTLVVLYYPEAILYIP